MKKLFWSAFLFLALAAPALAHCDTEDGPVVRAGRAALQTGRPELASIWVQPGAEAELEAAFQTARAAGTPESDRAFLEVLIRVHREGEGEPYTGLKPAGTPVPPAVAALDRALDAGTSAGLEPAVQEAWEHLQPLRGYDPADVTAGRRYVAAYVEAIHRLEEGAQEHPHPAGCCER